MSALDLFAPDFPHGSREGYAKGCHGSACPNKEEGKLTCAQFEVKYQGDYNFRRAVNAGQTLDDIMAAEAAAAPVKPAPRTKAGAFIGQDSDTVTVADSHEPLPEVEPVTEVDEPDVVIHEHEPVVLETFSDEDLAEVANRKKTGKSVELKAFIDDARAEQTRRAEVAEHELAVAAPRPVDEAVVETAVETEPADDGQSREFEITDLRLQLGDLQRELGQEQSLSASRANTITALQTANGELRGKNNELVEYVTAQVLAIEGVIRERDEAKQRVIELELELDVAKTTVKHVPVAVEAVSSVRIEPTDAGGIVVTASGVQLEASELLYAARDAYEAKKTAA